MKLPKIVCTIVVRRAEEGNMHGGIYVVDLEKQTFKMVFRCDDQNIDWSGRGGERGLRGVAFYNDRIFVAASSEILIFDLNFNIIDKIQNQYFKQIHEICIDNGILYVTSTSIDSVILIDILEKSPILCINFKKKKILKSEFINRIEKNINIDLCNISYKILYPHEFEKLNIGDTMHINNVYVNQGELVVSPGNHNYLYTWNENKITKFVKTAMGTHNGLIRNNKLIFNDTRAKKIVYQDMDTRKKIDFRLPRYTGNNHQSGVISEKIAKPSFARGLCITRDYIIGGSSPATINVYSLNNKTLIKSVNISENIRYAIHGLELWPY